MYRVKMLGGEWPRFVQIVEYFLPVSGSKAKVLRGEWDKGNNEVTDWGISQILHKTGPCQCFSAKQILIHHKGLILDL